MKPKRLLLLTLYFARIFVLLAIAGSFFSAIACLLFDWAGPPNDSLLWLCVAGLFIQMFSDTARIRIDG